MLRDALEDGGIYLPSRRHHVFSGPINVWIRITHIFVVYKQYSTSTCDQTPIVAVSLVTVGSLRLVNLNTTTKEIRVSSTSQPQPRGSIVTQGVLEVAYYSTVYGPHYFWGSVW